MATVKSGDSPLQVKHRARATTSANDALPRLQPVCARIVSIIGKHRGSSARRYEPQWAIDVEAKARTARQRKDRTGLEGAYPCCNDRETAIAPTYRTACVSFHAHGARAAAPAPHQSCWRPWLSVAGVAWRNAKTN